MVEVRAVRWWKESSEEKMREVAERGWGWGVMT